MIIDQFEGENSIEKAKPFFVSLASMFLTAALFTWVYVLTHISIIKYPPITTMLVLPRAEIFLTIGFAFFSAVLLGVSWARRESTYYVRGVLSILILVFLLSILLAGYTAKMYFATSW